MLVPTNSTLMQFLAGPSDHSTRSQVSSILHPGDDPLIGFHPFAFLVHHSDDRLNHKFRHGLISGGCVDSKPTQQRLRKAERYILMSSDLHRSKCITEICDPAESETKAQLQLKRPSFNVFRISPKLGDVRFTLGSAISCPSDALRPRILQASHFSCSSPSVATTQSI